MATNDLLSTREAAARLSISDSRVRHFIRDGRLAAFKRGHDLWLRVEDVEAFATLERRPGNHSGRSRRSTTAAHSDIASDTTAAAPSPAV